MMDNTNTPGWARTTFLFVLLLASSCKNKVVDDSLYSGPLFQENIRSTGPRTPEEERLGFKLPPGFDIQLFASEPNIDKPINMTFDAQGRLWVTQSFEYPFPASPGSKGKDRLTILEDTDHDGKADRFTDVLDSLNIPIGILPLKEGTFVYDIPNLHKYIDQDGDGKPDTKKFMLGPFGYRDTHGMVSNLVRGYDGWIHACHGFANTSAIAGSDGDSIKLVSGNTFRFRLDGSRVEQMTFGQVNPFGLAFDEYGYAYTTDSHSAPLHQLVRGGDYPHFGKQEIMAFGPVMKPLETESTALCGIAYYGDTQFPKEFQGNFFIGDVVNSRVHRYTWTLNGSSPVGKSEIDFVKSEDPWFRPVNIKLGPDGALYIADFYNAIIGHYEVSLDHPKRDKERGRIWRITYKGKHNDPINLATFPLQELLNALDVDNLPVRMLATDQLTDRIGQEALPELASVLGNEKTSPRKHIHALWALFRLQGLDDETLKKSLAHPSPIVKVHALRVLREWKPTDQGYYERILSSLKDNDPHVKRAGVELLMGFSDMRSVEATLAVLNTVPTTDNHLVYTSRLCLRNLLRNPELMKQVGAREWEQGDAGFIAGTLVDVASPEAAAFLAKYVGQYSMPREKTQLAYQQVMRYIPENQWEAVITKAKDNAALDLNMKSMVFKGIRDGLQQRGAKGNALQRLEPWGIEISKTLLEKYTALDTASSKEILSLRNFALQLAGDYTIASLEPVLLQYLGEGSTANHDLKVSALRSLLKLAPDRGMAVAKNMLLDDSVETRLKNRFVSMMGEFPGTATNHILMEIKNAPPDLELSIVGVLANSKEGKDIILSNVKKGVFMARTLVNPRVEERILLNITPQQKKVYDGLVANLGSVSKERQVLIEDRLKSFKAFKPTPVQLDSGQVVFESHCGTCHKKETLTGIGPQLHGIGKRGADALAEKILDPNRNISEAFRNYTVKMKNGSVINGLLKSEQGATLVFVDPAGKELTVAKGDMVESKVSRYTIMPDNFGTSISQKDFNKLLAYLLTW